MMNQDKPSPPSPLRAARVCFASTLTLLLVGLAPLPLGWASVRSLLDCTRSSELNRTDREAVAGGYYEGLIGGGEGPEAGRGELALRLLGKPVDWTRFHAANVTRPLPGDFLQFELRPDLKKTLFGRPFTTNGHGQRDHAHSITKPPGVFRIAVLGSSIDMGWGVDIDEIYIKNLENWLNIHAVRRGMRRRFEVVNFAVAAYSPVQRLESFRRRAAAFDPDMVIYSATMLDIRLTEIHLCDLFQDPGVNDLGFDFLRKIVADAGISADDLSRDAQGKLAHKDVIKTKLRPYYWSVYDAVLATLAADCRSSGIACACVIIPRAGTIDAPDARASSVARLKGIAEHHAMTMFDLSDTFDNIDPSRIEIAAWDDHPNTKGHQRLFLALARALIQDRALYETLFLSAEDEQIPALSDLSPNAPRPPGRPTLTLEQIEPTPQDSPSAQKVIHLLAPVERIRVLTQPSVADAVRALFPSRSFGETGGE